MVCPSTGRRAILKMDDDLTLVCYRYPPIGRKHRLIAIDGFLDEIIGPPACQGVKTIAALRVRTLLGDDLATPRILERKPHARSRFAASSKTPCRRLKKPHNARDG